MTSPFDEVILDKQAADWANHLFDKLKRTRPNLSNEERKDLIRVEARRIYQNHPDCWRAISNVLYPEVSRLNRVLQRVQKDKLMGIICGRTLSKNERHQRREPSKRPPQSPRV